MEVLRNIQVPTGNILVVRGQHGKLECLSLGDYGKTANVKADFLGYHKPVNGVRHQELEPLEEKWVVTISTQYGCSMGCKFCDVPKVGAGRNATVDDMLSQVRCALDVHPEVKHTRRLNVHFARMGEPTFNHGVIDAAKAMRNVMVGEWGWGYHPVVSTMCPPHRHFNSFIMDWLHVKNEVCEGDAGLQLSINTTDGDARARLFNGNAMGLPVLSSVMADALSKTGLSGRKITLNFAIGGDPVHAQWLADLFDPQYFMCKLTPLHVTTACERNGLKTDEGYTAYTPYEKVEEDLKKAGFDVLVFVPSPEEDQGRITCGNAILSGTMPTCDYAEA